MTTPQVEKLLNELKKLPENKECVNCLSVSKVGHGNICVPFGTFVCSDCKSAHQAFSHRIKSVTMSIWTKDDVDKLRPERGGSNENARRKYFARYDERRLPRPQKGDDHTVWKDFIKQVYIDKRFCGDAGGDDEGHAGSRRSPAASRGRDAGERRPSRDDDYGDSYKRQSSREQPRSRRYDDEDEFDSPRGGQPDAYDRHGDRSGPRRHDDYERSRDPYDSRSSPTSSSSSRRRDDYGGPRDADGDDEVRVRRRDRGTAPRTAAPRNNAKAQAQAPGWASQASQASQAADVDLLGDFSAPGDAGLSTQMAGMSVSADDDWASFEGPSSTATAAQAGSQQAPVDLFSAAPAPKTASPLPDILSMYSGAPAPAPAMGGMAGMGMGMAAPMGSMGAMGRPPGMHAPMGMGAGGVNPAIRPMGMPAMNYGMAGMPQTQMGMGMGGGFAAPMAPMGMPAAPRAPAPVYSGLGANMLAQANQPSVFDAFGTGAGAWTPGKGGPTPGHPKPKQDQGKFNDLRW